MLYYEADPCTYNTRMRYQCRTMFHRWKALKVIICDVTVTLEVTFELAIVIADSNKGIKYMSYSRSTPDFAHCIEAINAD